MNRRTLLFTRKTVRDCSSPKLLVAFLLPYLGLTVLLATAFSSLAPDDLGASALFTQERVLIELYGQLAFIWLTAFPMIFIGVLAAIVIAGESQSGTFELLLSKPVSRWEPLVGKYLGIVLFGFLTTLTGLFVGAAAIFTFSGASAQAIAGGIGVLLPGVVVYALVISVFLAAVGTLFAVLTGSRLKTALATAVIPVLFFAFMFVRLLPVGDTYERFFLYFMDVNYHFGNFFVLIQETIGPGFNSETAGSFSAVSGVYEITGAWTDPILGGIVGSVPLAGYVPPAVSSALVLVFSVAVLAGAVYQFERTDIH
jgi:ABC-2 type transport system permease protein